MRITESQLRCIIRDLLIENFSVESRKSLEKIAAILNMTLEKSSNKDISYMMQVYDVILLMNGFKKIGEGVSRKAYSRDNDFFVIKIAISNEGAAVNKSEVDTSRGQHGYDTQNMFIDMYDYDKISKNPHWIICEKVIPIKSIKDINVLNKIFPTFYEITNGVLDKPYEFLEFIDDAIFELVNMLGLPARSDLDFKKPSKDKYFSGKDIEHEDYYFSDIDSDRVKYDLIYSGNYFKDFLKKIERLWDEWMDRPVSELNIKNVKPGEDITRLTNCFKHIHSTDLHGGNLAVKYNQNLSPKDIVILDLDFDISPGK